MDRRSHNNLVNQLIPHCGCDVKEIWLPVSVEITKATSPTHKGKEATYEVGNKVTWLSLLVATATASLGLIMEQLVWALGKYWPSLSLSESADRCQLRFHIATVYLVKKTFVIKTFI